MTRVRIENASYLVTVDDTDTRPPATPPVVVEDGLITEVRGRTSVPAAMGGRRRRPCRRGRRPRPPAGGDLVSSTPAASS